MEIKKPIGLVADNGADLPLDFVRKNGIEIIQHPFYFPGEEQNVQPLLQQDFYRKMREGKKDNIFPKTSFASVQNMAQVYKKALENHEKILVITISSGLSGAFAAARQAKMLSAEPDRIEVFDSFAVTTPQGLLTIRAQELINRGKSMQEILTELQDFKSKVKMLGFVDDFSWLVAGGRIPEKVAKVVELFQKKGVRLALAMKAGKLSVAGVRFSTKDRIESIVNEFKNKENIKIAITHADDLEEAKILKEELEKVGKEVIFITEITPLIASHTGPGILVVGYFQD